MGKNKIVIKLYPVVLFCYNRPKHLKKTLSSLANNELCKQSELFVFSDGAKTEGDIEAVKEVREILTQIEGFKEVNIVEHPENKGLAASVISGVTEVLQQHSACIVLEDDLETSPYFLSFMNEALSLYKDDPRIFSVSGYCPPIDVPSDFHFQSFMFPRINSWGWGTWRDRWDKVDWGMQDFNHFISDRKRLAHLKQLGTDLPVMLLKQKQGKINSWAVRFNQACFNLGMTNVYPVQSMVRNQGADGSGTNMKFSGKYAVELSNQALSPSSIGTSSIINSSFRHFYKPSLFRRCINYVKIALYKAD